MAESPFLEAGSLTEVVQKKLSHFFKKAEGCELTGLYEIVIREVEKPLLTLVLERCRGNQLKAARMLGINRNTLRKKLRSLGIGGKT